MWYVFPYWEITSKHSDGRSPDVQTDKLCKLELDLIAV